MYVLDGVHKGICGMHIVGRSMATRIIRVGHYWPTLREDCTRYVKKCKECQEFNNFHHTPPKELYNITSPWILPYEEWIINLRPFPTAKSQIKFFLAIVDYFTKWIKAKI